MDKDLQALQEVRDLMLRARVAANELSAMDPRNAWEIAHKVGPALLPRAQYYAQQAVAETNIGRVEDKVLKNSIA